MQWWQNLPQLGWKSGKKNPSSSAFLRFSKTVKIERNNIGEVKEFSIVVDGYVAMKNANFHIRGSKGSWDKNCFSPSSDFSLSNISVNVA